MGKNTAATAAAGLDPSMGSPLALELDSIQQAEMQSLNIRRTGATRQGALNFEADLEKRRASFAGQAQQLAVEEGVGQAGTTVLGSWYRYDRQNSGSKLSV